jgi:hypothetical protein
MTEITPTSTIEKYTIQFSHGVVSGAEKKNTERLVDYFLL